MDSVLKVWSMFANKYGGSFTLSKEDNWVQLKIILPYKHRRSGTELD